MVLNIQIVTNLGAAAIVLGGALLVAPQTIAQELYLNNTNISVAVGPNTSGNNFHNTFDNGSTIDKVIDAPTADAEEFHNQTTHIWHTAAEPGGGLELLFDFGTAYDISTLHFWNYTSESYDVDNIEFTLFNKNNIEVGRLSVAPDLGSSPGIRSQDILLEAPLNVQFVTALLTGSNQQVDFQNIGFTAVVSAVILGDVNLDGVVNFSDISPFISILSAGGYQDEADTNEDGDVNFMDIGPFIDLLSGQ